jgi:uncharacterized PurR-regulated membrane protein YhhQ (DUF165 family)
MTTRLAFAAPVAAVYLASIVVANYLTTHYGFVPVGFGVTATAGTFAAGGALVVRDLLQDAVGRIGVALLILTGAGLSFLVASPAIAVASGAAFLVSEALDMTLYTPLRKRGRFGGRWWATAVTAGAVVGAVADTVVFLGVAFGRSAILPALPGQLVGKLEVAAALLLIGAVSGAVLRQPLDAEGA